MPCPACRGPEGLVRVRTRGVVLGERHYRCQDCRAVWCCPEFPPGAPLVRLGAVIETHAEPVVVALPAAPVRRLVGWDRGAG
jgi:hypothetical protein